MVGAERRCYAWDSRAQGYGRGAGVAVLVLKSLNAALQEGDRIRTVLNDPGLNQDGRTATIISLSMDAQIRLIHYTQCSGLRHNQADRQKFHCLSATHRWRNDAFHT